MGIRLKLFLLFFALGFLPMLALNLINYRYGVRTVEAMLQRDVSHDTRSLAHQVETSLSERESELVWLSRSTALRDYVREGASKQSAQNTEKSQTQARDGQASAPTNQGKGEASVPLEVASQIKAFFLNNQKYYAALTCLDQTGKVLFRLEPKAGGSEALEWSNLQFQTADFFSTIAPPTEEVWKIQKLVPLRSAVGRESYGAALRYTVPIFLEAESAEARRGALIADLKLDRIFKESAKDVTGAEGATQAGLAVPFVSQVVVVDRQGRIVYHTNDALKFQLVSSALPSFKPVADAMSNGTEGSIYYRATNGDEWLAAFQPIAPLDLSLATSRNYSAAISNLKRVGWASLAGAILVGLLTALFLTMIVRRTARSIERVTEGAVSIAAGNLDQRIDVTSSDETHLLAESFNLMTKRLREQIARETETRQFESFLRLSAMLTHDLKNAIAALSLLVRNMEHQFHHEEFRADAMRSLTEATDKLRNLVSKLSEPVRSMSGEHGIPRPTNLVPIIQRVLDTVAAPYGVQHKIDARLPESLVASVDAERMEKVLENLVLNALEAMGADEGTLTVEAGPLPDARIFFSVKDTGPGMSEDFQRRKLFRPFSTTKRKGVGLGLYTCREVVRAHGGEIEVESSQGTGTCFRVVLPSTQVTDR